MMTIDDMRACKTPVSALIVMRARMDIGYKPIINLDTAEVWCKGVFSLTLDDQAGFTKGGFLMWPADYVNDLGNTLARQQRIIEKANNFSAFR